jgi:type II secretory pathway pseudopilin PulG
MVVITIVGLLASSLLASMQNSRVAAQDAQRIQEARQLVTTLEYYRNQNGRYPCSGTAVACPAGAAGGATEAVLKNMSGTYTAHESALHTALNFRPGVDRTNATAIRYRLRSNSGNSNNNTDLTSYTIVVFLERQNTYCEINVGAGHVAYSYNACPVSGV